MTLDTSKIDADVLRDIISNMGWKEGEDAAPYLAQVAQMEPIDALRRWAAWQLGYRAWADSFVRSWSTLQAAQAQQEAA